MFRPDPDFFDSGDSASYHQDLSSIPTFSLPPKPRNRRQQQQSAAPSGFSLPLGPPMSTRQNKKQRKGRNNANNRERTVTTLTEDPNTPYLVPTPSEEPAGSHMPASFPGNSGGGGKMHNMSMGGPQYQMPNNFGYGYPPSFSPIQNMQQQQQPQQQQQQQPFFSPPSQSNQQHMQQQQPVPDVRPKVPLPPGKNDLEILQNLKKIIKDNQHPFYKAIPSPAALASLYKGTIPTHPQQSGRRSDQDSTEGQPPVTPSPTGFGQSAGGDRRPPKQPRMPPAGNDRRAGPVGAGGNLQNNNSGQGNQGNRFNNPPAGSSVANLNIANLKIGKNSSGPPSAGLQPEPRSSDLSAPTNGSNSNQDVSDGHRQGRYDYSARSRFQKSDFTATGDRPGDSSYDNQTTDVSIDGKASIYGGKDEMSRSTGWPPRDTVHPSNDRDYDSEHATTPRPQAAGGTADARPLGGIDRGAAPPGDGYDRDRDRSRRDDWQERDRRLSHDRARDSRLTDSRRSSSAAEQRPFEAEYGQPPVRRGPAEPSVPMDTRQVSEIPPASDNRPPGDSRPQPDTRVDPHIASARTADRLVPDTEDIQSSRSSSVRPADVPGPLGSMPPTASGDDLVNDASTRPTLKDRMNQPSRPQRTPSEVAAGPGEQPQQHQQHQHPPVLQDRSRRPNKFQKDRGSAYHGPYESPKTGDRGYHRPSTPPGPPPNSGGGPPPHRPFNPRSGSVDSRSKLPPPASRGGRDFRGPARDMSRDRPGNYRPEFHEPRYPGGVDQDAPRYEGRPYREFSPPPPMSGGRGPPSGDAPPGRGDYQYPPGRRDWGSAEDEDYYKSRGWDGPPPPPSGERGRYERDYPPPRTAGWDARPDREFVARDGYPPGPPGPPLDDRYPPGPPPMRDGDRGRPPPAGYNPPPYNRVRPRSPSPMRRPGPAPVDDSRPPMKRPREDFPPDYYSAGGRDNMRRPPGEYPPRPGSPGPPPGSGWAPPPSASSTGTMGGGPPGDRDYRMGRDTMDYPPPAEYNRPRSPGPPGPSGGRMSYNRGGGGYGRGGGEPRDRGGYGMQRP